MADIDTLDVKVAQQEELDVTVGSPMEHSRVLSITKNGKHVVSEYDLAEVDVHTELQEKTLHLHDISTQSVFNVTADDKNKELAKVTVDVSEISKKVTGDGEDDIPKTNPILAGDNPTVMGVLDKVKTRRIDTGENVYSDGTVTTDGIGAYGAFFGRTVAISNDIPARVVTQYIETCPPYDVILASTIVQWPTNYNIGIINNFRLSECKVIQLSFRKFNDCSKNGNVQQTFIVSENIERIVFPYLEELATYYQPIHSCPRLTIISVPKLKLFYSGYFANHSATGLAGECAALIRQEFPELVRFEVRQSSGSACSLMYNNANLQEIIAPKLSEIYTNVLYYGVNAVCVSCPAIRKIVIGTLTVLTHNFWTTNVLPFSQNRDPSVVNTPDLIHFEIGKDTDVNLDQFFQAYHPENAMDATKTDLIEDPTRCKTNREQFFTNFIELILHRLKDRTGETKYTLTLYTTVYEAIFNDDSGFVYNGQPISDYVTAYAASINWAIASV